MNNYTVYYSRKTRVGIATDFILMIAKNPEDCIDRFNKRSDRKKLGSIVKITDEHGTLVWPKN